VGQEPFAGSPDLTDGILNAITDASEALAMMNGQALDSEKIREGLRDSPLGPGKLYEPLRSWPGWNSGRRITPLIATG